MNIVIITAVAQIVRLLFPHMSEDANSTHIPYQAYSANAAIAF